MKATSIKGNGRINERIGSVICGILLLIILLITATQTLCYWIPGWWRNEYAKYNTPQYVTGEMSLDDAVYITEQMLEYCIGRIDTLDDTEATIDGVTSPFFTEREKLHLADCRNIFLGAVKFRIISVIVIAGLLIAIWFSFQKRSDASEIRKRYARTLAGGYLTALVILVVFAVFLIVVGMNNFTFLFTKFHHVFFDNDLWILDPRHDNLVNVMQESVFSDAAVTIGCIWGISSAVLAAVSAVILRKTSDVRS
jgi:integral membrane protein (TIGR01906 family)